MYRFQGAVEPNVVNHFIPEARIPRPYVKFRIPVPIFLSLNLLFIKLLNIRLEWGLVSLLIEATF
jgi:hypothetical protein